MRVAEEEEREEREGEREEGERGGKGEGEKGGGGGISEEVLGLADLEYGGGFLIELGLDLFINFPKVFSFFFFGIQQFEKKINFESF